MDKQEGGYYSLYAVVIRKGEGRLGSSRTDREPPRHYLLLRPDTQDGSWFRLSENRVENLWHPVVNNGMGVPVVPDWKCHKDFFCAAAVYVSDDYQCRSEPGGGPPQEDFNDVDLKESNPDLYFRTLASMNITDGQVMSLVSGASAAAASRVAAAAAIGANLNVGSEASPMGTEGFLPSCKALTGGGGGGTERYDDDDDDGGGVVGTSNAAARSRAAGERRASVGTGGGAKRGGGHTMSHVCDS
eukprot:GHVU01215658.1.p1 GENE.GHVU01215658.1~~GHVU01215658.1.p1  ORF type:complete len:282 (-),score=47.76 GHVU01215658.1:1682-2413(-)